MGEIEGWQCILGIAVAIGLGYVANYPPHPMLPGVVFGFVVITIIMVPFLRAATTRRTMALIDLERMEAAYSMLRFRPGSVGSQFKIAEVLYLRGYGRIALPVARGALEKMPADLFREEHKTYSRWQRELGQVNEPETLSCPKCGVPNQLTDVFCRSCGEAYLLDYARGRWMPGNLAGRVISVWLAAALLVIGIPALANAQLPPVARTMLIVLMALGAVGLSVAALLKVFDR